MARIRPVPAVSAESHRFLLPLTVPGLLRDCSKVQVARVRPLFPPSSQVAEETHHTVPTRCRVLVGTSAHPPAAFSRRRATDAPAGRPHPVLCGLVGALRAFGALSHHLRLHPAFDREGEGGACCCVPPSQRTSSPTSPRRGVRVLWVSAPPRKLCSRSEQPKFCSETRVPSHGILDIPSGAKVLQGIIPDLGNDFKNYLQNESCFDN